MKILALIVIFICNSAIAQNLDAPADSYGNYNSDGTYNQGPTNNYEEPVTDNGAVNFTNGANGESPNLENPASSEIYEPRAK